MKAALCIVLGCLAIGASFAHAQACHPPGSFYRTSAIRGTIAFEPGAGPDCDVVAGLDAIDSTSAGAYAWYTLPHPAQLWRVSFQVDTSQLNLDAFSSFYFLAASTRTPYPQDNGSVGLVSAGILSLSGDDIELAVDAACSSSPEYFCVSYADPALAEGDLIRLELSVGQGAKGYVRWWINSDFSDPPTGSMENLDNAGWGGVETVALGTFDSELLHAVQLRIYDIESSDDTVFWNGFSY